jgi:PEP-CTERM motif
MKCFGVTFGLMALLSVSSAYATPVTIYDTITGGQSPSDSRSFSLAPIGNPSGPLGDSFTVSGPTQLAFVTARLFDATNISDGGSVLVYLVPMDPLRLAPWTNGTNSSNTLTGKVLLGTILDSSMPTALTGACSALTACNSKIATNYEIGTAGTYWIELVSSAMTNNGGSGATSNANWEYTSHNSPTTGGIGTAGQYQSWQNVFGGLAAGNLVSTTGAFELTVQTPEPASLALLGIGLLGLGFSHRRTRSSSGQGCNGAIQ